MDNLGLATLRQRLEHESVVILTADEWERSQDAVTEVERHATGLVGDLVIVRLDDVFAAVESPTPAERVIRRLGSTAEASAFVAQRLAQYERMWEGCGCKIDYYA
jgi:uncharacterized membrane protein